MTFNEIFTAMYTLYRVEATVPTSTDDEYTIALRLANEAISRWANYDSTYWKELYTTAQENSTGGVVTVTAGTSSYAAPTAMREAGGFVKITDGSGNTLRSYQIIDPQEAQFKSDNAQYCFFTGDPTGGFTLHLNPAPDTAIDGMNIDYVYYKNPTLFTTGTDTTEMANPYFIVHRVLANRFRASRNPYYSSALRDAEDALKIMKFDNDTGSWANPMKMVDNSGSGWGV
jgi:hypothetical protein